MPRWPGRPRCIPVASGRPAAPTSCPGRLVSWLIVGRSLASRKEGPTVWACYGCAQSLRLPRDRWIQGAAAGRSQLLTCTALASGRCRPGPAVAERPGVRITEEVPPSSRHLRPPSSVTLRRGKPGLFRGHLHVAGRMHRSETTTRPAKPRSITPQAVPHGSKSARQGRAKVRAVCGLGYPSWLARIERLRTQANETRA
jgi:hypothetical protein